MTIDGPERPAGFASRHVGADPSERATMLDLLGLASLEELADRVVPAGIRDREPLRLPPARTEAEVASALAELAGRNEVYTSLIGLGYHATFTPPVVRRNVFENPAWYTAYTPYQPEISQGRLEALLNFQTMVAELTGMDVANASLLDEATAAAEAMALCHRLAPRRGDVFAVEPDVHPQTLEVVRTRAEPLGLSVEVVDVRSSGVPDATFGVLLQYPGSSGALHDDAALVARLAGDGIRVAVAADLLALCLLRPPGEIGADVVVGSAQRFGVPPGFGGPHAGYIAVRESATRNLPGRLVGVSVDASGRQAYRLALQTREQHIRREKATSNICTAQVLLAVMAGLYAVWHGPEGLRAIARRVHALATGLAASLRGGGVGVETAAFFDTITVRVEGRAEEIAAEARRRRINLRVVDADRLGISLDETTTESIVDRVLESFGIAAPALRGDAAGGGAAVEEPDAEGWDDGSPVPGALRRTTPYLGHPVFHRHRSETRMLRYLRRLADRDLALDRTMIPLGSCTMKLNATTEMEPISRPELAELHPFAPLDQAAGYLDLFRDLEAALAEITGYDAVSLQPNAGSQGELAGLLAIRRYHAERGEAHRDVCLIPSSAHGTNAASASMAGMGVVVVATAESGDVDVDDLAAKAGAHADDLAALMVTYPSTHGVFEERISEICGIVHRYGGQVYLDGANLNALVGLARPGRFGADVSHLNLHKTFCIPHGGGGPGVGPVAVREHLAPYLPNHPLVKEAGPATGVGPLTSAPWGSAGILPISWAYVALMGPDGLREATLVAILTANYVARRLAPHYPVLYTGRDGLVAHECILDLRPLTAATGVTVDDVAKRLVDFGFHAPTMSFPVPGTLMIEPTESEDLAELDRFCDAMIAIREEIAAVERGEVAVGESPLRHAPHPAADVVADDWSRPYARERAAYPPGVDPSVKYWPPVSRIDGAYGDRNVMCSCPPVTDVDDG